MGLTDSGFGVAFRFSVEGLPNIKQAGFELQRRIIELRQMQAATRRGSQEWRVMGAEIRGTSRKLQAAQLNIAQAVNQIDRISAAARFAGFAFSALGGIFAGIGGAGLLVMRSSVEEAIQFEAAMNALRIRSGATADELRGLSREFKRISEELPGTAIDMAKAGEIIAKTGTQIKDVAGTVREAITLSLSEPSLTAASAANLLARSMRAFSRDLDAVDKPAARFNSALIKISDSVAATASELADAGRRAGLMGTQIGLATPEILAFVAAAKDAGVTTQVAGSAAATFFKEIAINLPKVERILGKRVDDIPMVEVIQELLGVIGDLADKGNTAAAVNILKEFGVASKRNSLAVLAMARAQTQLVDAADGTGLKVSRLTQIINRGSDAFREGTLSAERQIELQKALSFQLDKLRSVWVNLKISFGEGLLPIIKFLTFGLQILVNAFNALPEPIKKVMAVSITLFSLAAAGFGAMLLAAGAVAFAVSSIAISLRFAGVEMATLGTTWTIVSKNMVFWTEAVTARLLAQSFVLRRVALVATRTGKAFLFLGRMGRFALRSMLFFARGLFAVLVTGLSFLLNPFVLPFAIALFLGMAAAWDRLKNRGEKLSLAISGIVRAFKEGVITGKQFNALQDTGLLGIANTFARIGILVREFIEEFKLGIPQIKEAFNDLGTSFLLVLDSLGLIDSKTKGEFLAGDTFTKLSIITRGFANLIGFLTVKTLQFLTVLNLAVSTFIRLLDLFTSFKMAAALGVVGVALLAAGAATLNPLFVTAGTAALAAGGVSLTGAVLKSIFGGEDNSTNEKLAAINQDVVEANKIVQDAGTGFGGGFPDTFTGVTPGVNTSVAETVLSPAELTAVFGGQFVINLDGKRLAESSIQQTRRARSRRGVSSGPATGGRP